MSPCVPYLPVSPPVPYLPICQSVSLICQPGRLSPAATTLPLLRQSFTLPICRTLCRGRKRQPPTIGGGRGGRTNGRPATAAGGQWRGRRRVTVIGLVSPPALCHTSTRDDISTPAQQCSAYFTQTVIDAAAPRHHGTTAVRRPQPLFVVQVGERILADYWPLEGATSSASI